MLTELRIRNFAIIESVTLPLAPGFNVLTGETGAGKSIIVGALGLLVGDRAATDLVRTGAERATVEGVFEVGASPELAAALDARGLDAGEGTLVLKREVAAAGARARAWINGSPVTTSVLADIGRLLVNVHGQHEAQALLDEQSQRAILDLFGECAGEAARVAAAHHELQEARAAVKALRTRRDDARQRADYLEHVAREIADARLVEGEDARLADESRRLAHGEELRAFAGEVIDALDGGEDAVVRRVGHLQRALSGVQKIDPSTERLQALYDAAYYALEEFARQTASYADAIENDPARLEIVERRRDLIGRLVKKYGGSVAAAMDAGRSARAELDLLDSSVLDLRELDVRATAAETALTAAAAALSTKRRAAATRLGECRRGAAPRTGHAGWEVPRDARSSAGGGASGAEEVEHRVALNVGHDARALRAWRPAAKSRA